MARQNFGSFILPTILNKESFDFYQNGQNNFQRRTKFYNEFIEEAVSAEKTSDAFIAGGYFIKSKRDMFQQIEQF